MKTVNLKQNQTGFTLIEILIALAILSIALTAIIYGTSRNIKDTTYLQNKTIATWVGTDVINQLRANVLTLAEGEEVEKETEILNSTWAWRAKVTATENNRIKKISVTVYSPDKQNKIVHLESYIYVPPTP